MRLNLLVLALAVPMVLSFARGGDRAVAEALWAHAVVESGGDRTHPLFIDATRELSRIRPWQAGYAQARARRQEVLTARLGAFH